MRNIADKLAERVTELEQQARKHEASTTWRLDDLENVIRYLAEDASEEARRKLGRLGLLLPARAS